MDFSAIIKEAKQAATQAEQEYMKAHGEPAYCGFAWVEVVVSRTNSKEAKELKNYGFQNSWKPKRVYLWNVTDHHSQSMDVNECGAREYARVLNKHGLQAWACSRAD